MNTGPKHRHMHPIGRQPIARPDTKTVKFVPEYQKADMRNEKLLGILKGFVHKAVLNQRDIRQLKDSFKFDLSTRKPVKLGNTGVSVVYSKGKFYLMK